MKSVLIPQCVLHDDKLYVSCTHLNDLHDPRSIVGKVIYPPPADDKFYVYPTDKEVLEMEVVKKGRLVFWERTNNDYKYTRPFMSDKGDKGRENALCFTDRGRAGLDIDPVEFAKGNVLAVQFHFMIEEIQEFGNLVLCSFGDRLPVRIGVPSNRKNTLYAYTADGWQKIGEIKHKKWMSLKLTFRKDAYDVQIGEKTVTGLLYPLRKVNPVSISVMAMRLIIPCRPKALLSSTMWIR